MVPHQHGERGSSPRRPHRQTDRLTERLGANDGRLTMLTGKRALETPALNGDFVTQAHADHCESNGHMTYTLDGVDQGWCPRCGAVRDNVAETVAAIIGEDVRDVTVTHHGVTVDGIDVAVVYGRGSNVFCYGVEWVRDEPYGPGSGTRCYFPLDGDADQWFETVTGA